MEERKVADYFVIAGLPEDPDPIDENTLSDAGHLKEGHNQAPITDIGVVFPTLGEVAPPDYEVILRTPTGLSADLNHGSLRSVECYVCFRRGRDKPPLVDIGIMYDGKEDLMKDAAAVKQSVGGRIANVNNSTAITYITYRRGSETLPCNALVVMDICVVVASKGESPPHAFCCINKNLNKGIVGSDVFLCYKKSMNRAKLLTYSPAVLCRYPLRDLPNFIFPNTVPLFCLPMGATLELWPKKATKPRPVFSTFILTVSDAKHKVYGSAVTFYEEFPPERLTETQRELLDYSEDSENSLHMNKSICVLSHWPFSDAFEKWLLYLYNMVISNKGHEIPIERYVVQLLDEVPFPGPRTLLQLSTESAERVIMTQPEDLPLPHTAASFRQLLINLGPENSLLVLLLALTEQKILIHSLRPDILTAVAEAVSALPFPFKWQCPYIPLCPLGLVEILNAPLPFLIGVDSRFFDLYDPPPDVSCVDLDTNIITICESQRQTLNIKLLPKRPAKILRVALERLFDQLKKTPAGPVEESPELDIEFQRRKKEQAQELEVQEAFLKFMALTLKGYRSYLLPITSAPTVGTTDPQALFQLNEFLKSRDKAHQKFFSLLMRTQMFIRFIEERSFVTDGDQGMAFFDECTERLSHDEGSESRLIEPDMGQNSERTVFLLPPEPLAEGGPWLYKNFTLDPTLLKSKRHNHVFSLHPTPIPGSPMARRTKHEIKSAQKLARKCVRAPELWARCLLGTCHTLYFMALPSMLSLNVGKERQILQQAYDLLVKATQLRLNCDEVCYRLMMQLCGEHSRPLLAVKLLLLMKKNGIQPNALTYGLYNRCVLEAEWPAYSTSSQLLWNKLRNVMIGVAHFRWAGKKHATRKLSASTEGGSSLLDTTERSSQLSLDSHEAVQPETSLFDRLRTQVASIVKGSDSAPRPEKVAPTAVLDLPNEIEEEIVTNGLETVASEEDLKTVTASMSPGSPNEYMRLLSRSESANDANILDKLQQNNNKKNCSRNLQFEEDNDQDDDLNKMSPTKLSTRTPVTENDPLGALELPEVEITVSKVDTNEDRVSIENNRVPLANDEPVLFRSSVQRSATFEGSPPTANKLHRSETVPAASLTSSLVGLGSTLKMGFSRYSPARLSLRKSDLKVPQQFIESAINNFSPSSLTGKKSNELIQGGISSMKSAAASVVKKLDEIKEAISTSTTSTPVKAPGSDRMGGGGGDLGNDVTEEAGSTDGSDGGAERHRKISGELGSYRGSNANLRDSEENIPECLYPPPSENTATDCEVEIILTSCSQCHNCLALLYDEEIMANWSPEDSNLNTICTTCSKATVPLLTITISHPKNGESKNEPPFCVPYLNPVVLRKELENVLAEEGDLSLAKEQFVEQHPIIYWNLVWNFERINAQSHVPNLCLKNRVRNNVGEKGGTEKNNNEGVYNGDVGECGMVMRKVEEGTDPLTQELATIEHLAVQVCVRCLWDDPRLHGENTPMYILWQRRDTASPLVSALTDTSTISKAVMQMIINNVRCNEVLESLKRLATERQRLQKVRGGVVDRTHSTYRDILFLVCKVIGRANVDLNAFDREYQTSFGRLPERMLKLFREQDKPLGVGAAYCRQYFRPLSLS